MSDKREGAPEKASTGELESGAAEAGPSATPAKPGLPWLARTAAAEPDTASESGESEASTAPAPAAARISVPTNVVPLEPSRWREAERHEPDSPRADAAQAEQRFEEQQPPTGTDEAQVSRWAPPHDEYRRDERPPKAPPQQPRPQTASSEARRRRVEETPEEESETFRRVATEAAARAARVEERPDYSAVVRSVQRHLSNGYSLFGLVGYSGSGKTHFLRAMSLLLRQQGFEGAAWENLRRARVPGLNEAFVSDYPCTGPRGEKWVFVDAGGELYARLRANDWKIPERSAALLHSLHHCRGLFLLLHLQPGHFRAGSIGSHRWMSENDTEIDLAAQQAQEELEFFDHVLLFLRALKQEKGSVRELIDRCAREDLDKALRPYRDQAQKLDLPVMVLFTQADTFGGSQVELATGSFLSPRTGTVNVAAFVARHVPGLFGSLVRHTRRFKFDFVQSYEEVLVPGHSNPDGTQAMLPKWQVDDELLSVGVLPALEFLYRNLATESGRRRHVHRFELEARAALHLHRLIHRRDWQGVDVP